MGTRVIKKVVDIVVQYYLFAKHTIFFDNFFKFLHKLPINGWSRSTKYRKAIATVRESRTTGASKAMTSSKELQKNY